MALEQVTNPGEAGGELLAISMPPEQIGQIIEKQAEAIRSVPETAPSGVVIFRNIPQNEWERISKLTAEEAAKELQSKGDSFPIVESQASALREADSKLPGFAKIMLNKAKSLPGKAISFAAAKAGASPEEVETRTWITGLKGASGIGIEPLVQAPVIVVFLASGVATGPLAIIAIPVINHFIASLGFDTPAIMGKYLYERKQEKSKVADRNEILERLFTEIYFSERREGKNPEEIRKEMEVLMQLYEFQVLSGKFLKGQLSDREKSRRLELKERIKKAMADSKLQEAARSSSIYSTLLHYLTLSGDESSKQNEISNRLAQRIGAERWQALFSNLKPEEMAKTLNELAELENSLASTRRKIWPLHQVILSGFMPFMDYRTCRDMFRFFFRKSGSLIKGSAMAAKSAAQSMAGGPKSYGFVRWIPVKVFRFAGKETAGSGIAGVENRAARFEAMRPEQPSGELHAAAQSKGGFFRLGGRLFRLKPKESNISETNSEKKMSIVAQSSHLTCVPASLQMMFSFYGIDLPESRLIEKYFPEAPERGVFMRELVEEMPRIIRDLGAELDFEILDPALGGYCDGKEIIFMVKNPSEAIRERKEAVENEKKELERKLAAGERIPSRMSREVSIMQLESLNDELLYLENLARLPNRLYAVKRGLYGELEKRGQSRIEKEITGFASYPVLFAGSHGGSLHAEVMDPSETTKERVSVNDPYKGVKYSIRTLEILESDHYLGSGGNKAIRLVTKKRTPFVKRMFAKAVTLVGKEPAARNAAQPEELKAKASMQETRRDAFLLNIQNKINTLKRLYEEKRNNPSRAATISQEELKIAQFLLNYFRKNFIDDLISITTKRAEKGEFVISLDELRRVLREKNVKENLSHLFGLGEMKSELERMLNSIRQNALSEESGLLEHLESRINGLAGYEGVLHDYFNEASSLKYNKRVMTIGQTAIKGASKAFLALKNLKLHVKGKENMPSVGPVIFASRHYAESYDTGIVFYVSRRKVHFVAGSVLWGAVAGKPAIGKLFYKSGMVPFKWEGKKIREDLKEKTEQFEKTFSNTGSTRDIMSLLNHGEVVCIFPEGTTQYSRYSEPISRPYSPPNKGYVFLAYMVYKKYGRKVPIVPMGLNYGPTPTDPHKTNFKWCYARIGNPFYIPFERFVDKDKRYVSEMLDYYTNAIFSQIKFLSENWDGDPPEIPYPEDLSVIKQAEEVIAKGTKEEQVEERVEEAQLKRIKSLIEVM